MDLRPAGDRAVLAVFDRSISASHLNAAARAAQRATGVVACIVGHSSLLTIWNSAPDAEALQRAIATADKLPTDPETRTHSIRVSFHDGADLDEFLTRAGTSIEPFLQRIGLLRLTARYLGFRAGFAYLDGWPEEWAMPRRATSRPLVEAGTFGIAGAAAGFYPADSPGGWNLLGRTDTVLWDEERDPPNLIAPGDVVLIEPTREPLPARAQRKEAARLELPYADLVSAPLAQVVQAQDWRRVGSGLSAGGPFDARAASFANLAAGQPCDAALLECAIAGPRLRMLEAGVLSWYGARAEVLVNGRPVSHAQQFVVVRGDEVAVGRMQDGLRGYLAFGTRAGAVSACSSDDRLTIRVRQGPHEPLRGPVVCEVTPQLNRVGIRMRLVEGVPPDIPADLVSCGMQFGTVQLHPDRTLVAMGPDHPVTGGYLQPMTVVSGDLWKLAQLMPGDRVRFVEEGRSKK